MEQLTRENLTPFNKIQQKERRLHEIEKQGEENLDLSVMDALTGVYKNRSVSEVAKRIFGSA